MFGPELIPVSRQSAHRWQVINPAVGCHYFPLGPRLPSQLKSITAFWPVRNYTAWWQRHMCVNNLPRVITWKWNGRNSNLLPLDCEPSAHYHATHMIGHYLIWEIWPSLYKKVCRCPSCTLQMLLLLPGCPTTDVNCIRKKKIRSQIRSAEMSCMPSTVSHVPHTYTLHTRC